MATQFAGARWLDERRRRRLAVDQGADDMTDETKAAEGDGVSKKKPARPATLSIRSIVPRSGWAVLAWSLLLLGACDAVIAAAWFQQSIPEQFQAPYSMVFGLGSATAATWMAGALLVVAAQMALVIGWVRGHCLTDFDGHYRAWTRVAISWLVIAGVVGTGAHQPMAQMLLAQFGFETLWQREILSWLLPLGALVASVVWVMDGELKTCRTARMLMWISASTAIAGLVLVLEPTLIDAGLLQRMPQLVTFLKLAAMVSAPGLLVVSMGVFLRHVVHVSPEPAPRRKWRRKTKKQKRARTSDGVESEGVSEELADELADEDAVEEEYEEEEVEEGEDAVEEEQESEEDAYVYSEYGDSTPGSYSDDDSHYRIDEAEVATDYSGGFPDPEALKGLSKRERRRLRKQWRDQQRQSDG
jgi:hypothetical protein